MELEKHFASLDDLNIEKKSEIKNCCEIEENYNLSNGMIGCRICKNIITNISENAEWKYYGANNSKPSDPT